VAKHQRSLKNLLISPVEQFAFGFRILIAPLMVVLIMGLAFLQPVINQSKMLAPHLAPSTAWISRSRRRTRPCS
jgi:hypothetical protein